TKDVEAALSTLRQSALVLFPLSLLVTAAISGVYAARSLRPVADLTEHASGMIKRLGQEVGSTTQTDGDELQVLATTFNQLFDRLETVVGQLRQFASDASHEL